MTTIDRYPPEKRPASRRSVKITQTDGNPNVARQRVAVKRMTECEVLTGLTVEQLDEFHAAQRARVLARFGPIA